MEFFYIVKDTIVSGQTLWDRSKYYYGEGQSWDSIVAQNAFLQEEGRVWKDKKTGIWYGLIRPKEVLNIKQKATVTFIDKVEEPLLSKESGARYERF